MILQNHKQQMIILMTLLFFLSQACTDIYVPGLPQMTREFHTDIHKMSLTITVYTYSQAFFFLFTGVISDLLGRRKVIIPCIAIQVVASLLIALNHSLDIMIFLRILQAIGSAAIYIVMRLIIKDVMNRDEQIQAVGIFVTALPLSLAIAPVAGALIIKYWGWRYCFSLVGLVQAGLLLWAVILIQETNHKTRIFRKQFKFKSYIQSYFTVLNDKLFYNLTLLIGGVFASFYGFITISSYMYINEYHVSSILYSYTYIAIAVFYLIGNQIMLWMNRKQISSWNMIKTGIIISVFGVLLVIVGVPFKSFGWLALSLITSGIILLRMATAFINPPIQVAMTHHFGNNGAQALGLLSSLQYIFAGIGTIVASSLPWAPSMNLTICSIIFCLISFLGYYFCPTLK